jgi:hemolysin activation/secretion protein
VTGGGVRLTWAQRPSIVWRLAGGVERQRPLKVNAAPASGRYEPTIAARSQSGPRLVLTVEHPTTLGWLGFEASARADIRYMSMKRVGAPPGTLPSDDGRSRVMRGSAAMSAERPLGRARLVLRTTVAGVGSADFLAPQDFVYLGGPTTGPGYEANGFVAERGASQRVEVRLPVPFFALPLGRFGKAPGEATLAPFVHAVAVDRILASPSGGAGVFPALGIGLLAPFDILRFDVARGLHNGRWTFSVDVSREFWSVL